MSALDRLTVALADRYRIERELGAGGPGNAQRLGKVPRSVAGVSVSDDLKRAVVIESDYHGDAYMSRIVRP